MLRKVPKRNKKKMLLKDKIKIKMYVVQIIFNEFIKINIIYFS